MKSNFIDIRCFLYFAYSRHWSHFQFNFYLSSINSNRSNDHTKHHLAFNSLTPKQIFCLSSLLIDINNRCNKFLPLFSPFNREFSLGNQLINTFPDHFSFNFQTHNVKNYLHKLEDITVQASSDASIKNHVATLFSHIHSFNRPIIKMCYHAVNVSTTEAKLFAMRCSINQAADIPHIKYIIVIIDSIHSAKKIFDSSLHPYQIHLSRSSTVDFILFFLFHFYFTFLFFFF